MNKISNYKYFSKDHYLNRTIIKLWENKKSWIPLTIISFLIPFRKTIADPRIDTKILYYKEDDGRMEIISPTILFENETDSGLQIKIEGIYNAISGASPTGEPSNSGSGTQVSNNDDDNDHDDDDDDSERSGTLKTTQPYNGVSGATSQATTPQLVIPLKKVEDTRIGASLELSKELQQHKLSVQTSFSHEDDYNAYAIALKDNIFFNKKNTTLLTGISYGYDLVDVNYSGTEETKENIDLLLGFSQLLSPNTLFRFLKTISQSSGFLNDPYKVAEVNSELLNEHRPDTKDKQTVFLSLNHFFHILQAAPEISYRYYTDSFGINAHTATFSWYQKLKNNFILRPYLRYYDQNEADFYSVRFTGNPTYYSSDYRLSALTTTSYGLKVIYQIPDKWAFDITYEQYKMEGKDNVTHPSLYPTANMYTIGVRKWF